MEMNKAEAINQAVAAGFDLVAAPLHTVQAELASGLLCVSDVKGFALMRQWCLAWRDGRCLRHSAAAFTQLVHDEVARQHVPSCRIAQVS